jgi:DNA-binding Lrp family transcriptional regulator
MYMPLRDLEHAATGEGLSSATVLVVMAMAHRTDVDGTTRAGVRELARQLHRSPGTIQRHVKRLVDAGFVEETGCREDNRYRLWRIAGMDRRDHVASGPGENHHRGPATSRAGGARHGATSRAGGARIPVELPGELIELTRASTQQGGERPRAGTPQGVQLVREAVERRRSLSGGCDGPGALAGPSDDAQEPPGVLSAENRTQDGAEGSAGSAPEGAPRSVTDGASRCPVERGALPSCSTMDTNPDDYEPEVPDDDPDVDEPSGPEPATGPAPFPGGPETPEPAESPPETATSGI